MVAGVTLPDGQQAAGVTLSGGEPVASGALSGGPQPASGTLSGGEQGASVTRSGGEQAAASAAFPAGEQAAGVRLPRTVTLPKVEDTEEFGRRLGGLVRGGDLLLLAGPLGAGKTALVRGLAAGLGVTGRVS